ncbi:hypothetical protein GCM10010282_04540 [Streptomyces roseolus]|nr:hypothetical protein GCM10010282_04540 [Streptomyces roseolus]
MGIAVTHEQRDLARPVRAWLTRAAPPEELRRRLDAPEPPAGPPTGTPPPRRASSGSTYRRSTVVGVGTTRFEKPGTRDRQHWDMAREAGTAALVASARFVAEHGPEERAVEIAGQAMTTDTGESFASGSCVDAVGRPMSREAARRAYEASGLGIEDVDVIELHDCFSVNEPLTYEALGLCAEGASGKLVESGATTYGGRRVVNPSGGLISKGHPLGATGPAQAAELVRQLRGEAADRQVPGARVGLAHNIGLGGAAVVTLLRRRA